jgi:hypothetical protein
MRTKRPDRGRRYPARADETQALSSWFLVLSMLIPASALLTIS